MEIKVNNSIREKYHSGFPRETEVTTIVLHGAGVAKSLHGLIKWMMDGERAESYYEGVALFHYGIDRNGDIVELIDPNKRVYHSSSGMYDDKTIGIELINGHVSNKAPYTYEQYASLFYLIFDKLMIDFPLINIITTHERLGMKYSGRWKNCPGNFDYYKLVKEFEKRKLFYQTKEGLNSYWGIYESK